MNEGQHNEGAARIKIKRIIWFSLILDVIILDQITKWYLTEFVLRPHMNLGDGLDLMSWYVQAPSMLPFTSIEITSFFNLVMAWNTGVSFSLFSQSGDYMPYALICLALGITGLFAYWMMHAQNMLQGIAYALVIGGALGNVIDRARFGAVIDFLDVHAYGYHWPAFNVADMAVVGGICLLIIISLAFDLERKDRYLDQDKDKRSL